MAKVAIPKNVVIRLGDDPRYAEQERKLEGLKQQVAEIDRQIRETWSRINARSGIAEAAEALLDRGEVVTEGDINASQKTLRANLDELHDRKRIVEAAIRIQEARMRELGGKISAEICAELKPVATELIRQMGDALVQAARAKRRYAEFCEVLIEGGIRFENYLRPMQLRLSGHLDLADRNSTIHQWLREASEYYEVNFDLPDDAQPRPPRWPGMAKPKRESARERMQRILATITGQAVRLAEPSGS